jgi:dTDP-6-deoxy-L-talose 4-dehydrogenase (NAD+)
VIREGSAGRLVAGAGYRETVNLFGESETWWAEACRGVDTVVHAAWSIEPGVYLGSPDNVACLAGSLALALGARHAGVGHVVGIGTCFEYELTEAPLSVDAPLRPASLYAATKVALYHTLTALFAGSGTLFSWARLFYLHGDGEAAGRLVPSIRDSLARGEVAALSIGTQVRDFLDVQTAGAMLATLVDTRQPGAINICSGRPVTVRQLAERIADDYGRRDLLRFGASPLRPTDPPAVVGVCNLEPRWADKGG